MLGGTTPFDPRNPTSGSIEVHGAASSARTPGGRAQQFSHHQSWRNPLCQSVTVTTVRAGYVIIFTQLSTYARRHSFLPYIDVNEPRHAACAEYLPRLQFKLTNQNHAAIERQQTSREGCTRKLLPFSGRGSPPESRCRHAERRFASGGKANPLVLRGARENCSREGLHCFTRLRPTALNSRAGGTKCYHPAGTVSNCGRNDCGRKEA